MSCMTAKHDFQWVIMSSSRALCCFLSVKKQKHDFHFVFRSMYNKTIIRFGFCDIQNNQGLGKGYQPQPSAHNFFFSFFMADSCRQQINIVLLSEGKSPNVIVLNVFQDAEGQPVIIGVSAWGIHIFHNNRLINKFVW